MRELQRHLRGDNLCRVNRAGDYDDSLSFAHETVALRFVSDQARVCEAALDVAVSVEFAYILSGAYEGREERASLSRSAELLDAHAHARAVEALEVVRDLSPVGDLAVVAGSEAEHVPRRGHACERGLVFRVAYVVVYACGRARRGGGRGAPLRVGVGG